MARRSTSGTNGLSVFGALLRERRTRLGLTQAALSERSGVATVTISDLERGVWRAPRADTALLLADALELSPDERVDFFRVIAQERPRGAFRDTTEGDGAGTEPDGNVTPGLALALALTPMPGSLPRRLGPLLGREAETALLAGWVGRLATLTGPGGVGKTRLALDHAWRAADAGADVVWVGAEAIERPEDLLPAIARAAGASPDGGDPGDRAAEALRGRVVLLALDNLEHLLEAAPDISVLLERAPGVRALVTSREALRIDGERVLPVAPLALPERGLAGGALLANPSVALFLRQPEGEPESAVTGPDDLAAVARIVTMLDGLPLAIELAAAHRDELAAGAIAAMLDHAGLRALEGGRRDGPARFRTMEAAIGWSADRLSPDGQRLLSLLGLFRGGFTPDAAAGVAALADEPGLVAELPALARSSLVRGSAGAGGRMSLLEPVRLFADARLWNHGWREAARRAHAAWFHAHAARLAAEVLGPSPLTALDALEADLANIRAAVAASAALGDPEQALRTAGALRRFWEYRGSLTEGRATLATAIAAAPGGPGGPSDALLQALYTEGYLAVLQGDDRAVAAAIPRLEAAAAAAGSAEYAARACHLAWSRTRFAVQDRAATPGGGASDVDAAAEAVLRRGLALLAGGDAREGIDSAGWALTLLLGVELQERGESEAALPLLERALAAVVEAGCVIDQPVPMTRLGLALLDLGRIAEGRDCCAAAAAIAQRLDLWGMAHIPLLGWARAESLAGTAEALERAARCFGAIEALLERRGLRVHDGRSDDYGRYWNAALADSMARLETGLGAAWAAALRQEGRALTLGEAMALIPGAVMGD